MFECCREKMPDGGWCCLSGNTKCPYNDGYDKCSFPEESAQPLKDVEDRVLQRLAERCAEMTDEEFVRLVREFGYTKAVVLPETRKIIISKVLRVKSGCSDKSRISLDETCAYYSDCIGKRASCDFCRNRSAPIRTAFNRGTGPVVKTAE